MWEDTAAVCLMSGNFVQRGAPAVFDKTVRARAAVECGASLVLELPVTAALSSAEGFARGGVEILDRLGAVDTLCFGSETGDTDALVRAAEAMRSPEFTQALRTALDEGRSYPAARQLALERVSGDGALLTAPNDILAAEYCKGASGARQQNAAMAARRMAAITTRRRTRKIRRRPPCARSWSRGGTWRQLVPQTAAAVYADAARYSMRAGERAVLARLRGLTQEEWARVPFGSEGLWSKVWRAVQTEGSVEAILCAAKSKRYPRTRLQRLLLCAYLGIDAQTLLREAPYVRVLAFDEKGQDAAPRNAQKRRAPDRQRRRARPGRGIFRAGMPLRRALRAVFGKSGGDKWRAGRENQDFPEKKLKIACKAETDMIYYPSV